MANPAVFNGNGQVGVVGGSATNTGVFGRSTSGFGQPSCMQYRMAQVSPS